MANAYRIVLKQMKKKRVMENAATHSSMNVLLTKLSNQFMCSRISLFSLHLYTVHTVQCAWKKINGSTVFDKDARDRVHCAICMHCAFSINTVHIQKQRPEKRHLYLKIKTELRHTKWNGDSIFITSIMSHCYYHLSISLYLCSCCVVSSSAARPYRFICSEWQFPHVQGLWGEGRHKK